MISAGMRLKVCYASPVFRRRPAMKKLFILALLAFALVAGTVVVTTFGTQAVAQPNCPP
jgi:hypothetical protein